MDAAVLRSKQAEIEDLAKLRDYSKTLEHTFIDLNKKLGEMNDSMEVVGKVAANWGNVFKLMADKDREFVQTKVESLN